MAQLTREEFDAIEFGAARTGDHRDAAMRMSQLAAASAGTATSSGTDASSGPGAGEISPGEAYLRSGEQWLLADDPAAAADCFQRALASGGASVDARVSLARARFLLGEAEEGRKLISQLEAEGRTDPRKCDLVAELLVEQSDLIGALDWANAGVELCLSAVGVPPPDEGPSAAGWPSAAGTPPAGVPQAAVPRQLPPTVDRTELRMLLSLRYRIRNDMGLDEDAYDKLLDEF